MPYRPEFAAQNKQGITAPSVLAHRRAGVVALDHCPRTYGDLVAGAPVFEAIASARPQWEPGTAHGVPRHHFRTHSQRNHRAGRGNRAALSIDCYIGLPDNEFPRLAKLILPDHDGEVELGSRVPDLAGL